MAKINPAGLDKMLTAAAQTVVNYNPEANYSASSTGSDMLSFVRTAIVHYGFNREEHFEDLLVYRESFEKKITKKYRVKFTYNTNEDLEAKYKKRKVPQLIQVKSGILDLLIGELNVVRINMNEVA